MFFFLIDLVFGVFTLRELIFGVRFEESVITFRNGGGESKY